MTIKKFTIYGERCSGTNYLEKIILKNFDVKLTWEYGWKHFFGFQDKKLEKSDDTLFICIVRDLYTWMNSFFREMHHLPLKFIKTSSENKIIYFLNSKFWSLYDAKTNKKFLKEIMEDRNIYTGDRYKNIFELRHTKNKFLIEDLPNKVKNYIFIRYEDLINNFRETMIKIKNKGLKVKNPKIFPINHTTYKKTKKKFVVNKKNHIAKRRIYNNKNLNTFYEKKLGYL